MTAEKIVQIVQSSKKLRKEVRIPMISAGGSDGRRPAVPRQGGRF
jgi:hypothetical protein